MIEDFISQIDFTKGVHVSPPTHLIFLCGGKTAPKSKKVQSLRDAFLKIPQNPVLDGRDVLLAERVNTFHMERPAYDNLLDFELDFAQVCDLVLLISESAGSIAELGCFAMNDAIASRLLVVVRDCYLQEDSFIKLGPLNHLEKKYGERAYFVLRDEDIGATSRSLKGVNINTLRDRLKNPVNLRMEEVRSKTSFDPKHVGHIIKLLVGFTQEFGGLTAAELRQLSLGFNVTLSEKRIDRLLLCAEAARWVHREKLGFEKYYFALPTKKDALQVRFEKGAKLFNRLRRREILREYWKEVDGQRHNRILAAAGGEA